MAALAGESEGGHVLRRPAPFAAAAGQCELIGVYVRAPSDLVQSEPIWLVGQRRLADGRIASVSGQVATLVATANRLRRMS